MEPAVGADVDDVELSGVFDALTPPLDDDFDGLSDEWGIRRYGSIDANTIASKHKRKSFHGREGFCKIEVELK